MTSPALQLSRRAVHVAALAALPCLFATAWSADDPKGPVGSGAADQRWISGIALHAAAAAEVQRVLSPRFPRLEIEPPPADAAGLVIDAGPIEIIARRLPSDSPPMARQMVWVDIRQAGVVRRSRAVVVSLRALQSGWVAAHDIDAGMRLGDAMFRREYIDVARGGLALWQGDPAGKTLRVGLRAGEALLAKHVGALPVVARGERVTVLHRNRALEVRAGAHAMQDGETGQTILVRVDGGTSLKVRVLGPGKTEFVQ